MRFIEYHLCSLSHPEEVGVLAHALQRRTEGVLEVGDLRVAVRDVLLFSLVVPPLQTPNPARETPIDTEHK